MAGHNGKQFSTFDQDNDAYGGDCSHHSGGNGGWWFNKCDHANPDGKFGLGIGEPGIDWAKWKDLHSFKSTEMKIRPVDHNSGQCVPVWQANVVNQFYS